ncbi:DNA damage-regulated autophagy modulator protein [Ooceraea biroi]|uniref:DNA damage-regulated autophagy modulator protein n=1 Tax=Ooceraea biroi TaxID=2015173 RepID=A0A026WLJ2_OOCBI|nr:DNA damage-regulated autophagy modulator protein [Ooceraea biroi]
MFLLGHVEAGFPYISDAATYAPESCIFSQVVNLIAILMCFTIYIRYSQVKECTNAFSSPACLPKWNHWALIFGLISSAGLSIVANFQETSVIVVHLIGALLCFGSGTAYFWTQAACSFYLHPSGCSLRLAHLRMALSTFCTVCFFVILITGVLARLAYKGTNPRKWYKEDGGWELHVASTITEWLCAMAFCAYILTFTEEFRDIRISPPKIIEITRLGMEILDILNSRGASGYVNLLSHSPVDTPCPGYRYRDSRDNLLDEAAPLVATTPPAMRDDAERSPDVLCPMLIHVHDPTIRERRSTGHHIEKRHRESVEDRSKKWIDLDENVLDDYVLIDDRNLDSSSHSKYARFRSARNDLEAVRDLDTTSYAVANSHGEHGDPTTDIRNRDYRCGSESDNPAWDVRATGVNYEIANSHSNYRVFYDSQTQHRAMVPPWPSELWPGNHRRESHATSEDSVAKKDSDECRENTNQSAKKNEEDSGTTCEIEQCLVQIEESLLNIEQNLLHVQDLDIPELRNLLYKSPSIERSLYEDLLYADGIVPVIARNKSMSVDSDEEEEEEDEEEVEEEEVWVGQNITIKDNDDEDGNAGAPLLNGSNEEPTDTTNEQNLSRSADDHYVDWIDGSNVMQEETRDSSHRTDPEKAMNFIPNSLGKTPRRIVLDEVEENIRLCSSEPEELTITIDYNLNSACAEKKSLFRDKWHSRTNSLDENSIFQNPEFIDNQENGKSSLQNIFLESAENRRLAAGVKARSEGALQPDASKRRDRRGSHEEKLLQAVEATAEDFRKKLESFASQRRTILADKQRRVTPRSDTLSRSKSPTKSKRTTAARNQDRDNGAGKNTGCDKRKRKKSGKSQSTTENALEPSKLISLSLSLLLAALLQAVRCLTDLVEDAFRSISYDRSGLLQ